MSSPAHAMESSVVGCSPIVELRQYTLHPGKRNALIELFERHFIEAQEAAGMALIGQFRDLDDPDRFVWLRGFVDMPSRAQALAGFYGGPVWRADREAANATMIDSDNVLLLRPLMAGEGFMGDPRQRPACGCRSESESLIVITLWHCKAPPIAGFADFFADRMAPLWVGCGGSLLAAFVTEDSANNFPALPVREGEHVYVSVAGFADHGTYARHVAALMHSQPWQAMCATALADYLVRAPETLRLAPTARSLLRATDRPALAPIFSDGVVP